MIERGNGVPSGLVVKAYGGFFYLKKLTGDNNNQPLIVATVRGKLKLSTANSELPPVVVGDKVDFIEDNAAAVIVKVHPRSSELIRPPIANIDQVVVVCAASVPVPDFQLMDRITVRAEAEKLAVVIVINKIDSAREEILGQLQQHLRGLPYPVIKTSAVTGEGLTDLKQALLGRISVMAGPSGVGKSSLLMKLIPDYEPKIQDVSQKTARGRHTTKHVELLAIPGSGYIADTPGFSNINLDQIELAELPLLFPEFADYRLDCKFSSCMHIPEPDCAVKQALAEKKLSASRYRNYCQMVAEIQAQRKW